MNGNRQDLYKKHQSLFVAGVLDDEWASSNNALHVGRKLHCSSLI